MDSCPFYTVLYQQTPNFLCNFDVRLLRAYQVRDCIGFTPI
jgi:hypothetical protein